MRRNYSSQKLQDHTVRHAKAIALVAAVKAGDLSIQDAATRLRALGYVRRGNLFVDRNDKHIAVSLA